ncbi:MAG: hypothetical protein EPN57_17340 [Paraburkholderia sp.]|nr:MAG: hypothetical protein EPN57_17340 [Paraburkholderia sp.]
MLIRDRFSNSPDGIVAARQHREMIGVLALAGQVTIVDQEKKHEAAMFRFLCAYAGAGRKKLLPFGLGAGVRTLYCCDRFYEADLHDRMERVKVRDPYPSSRDRARENLVRYWLELEQKSRYEQSLVTQSGQRQLLEQARRHDSRLLIFDALDDWTLMESKETAENLPATFSELLEKLTSRGISVLIFTSGTKGRKIIPALLGPLPYNKVFIRKDKGRRVPGSLRLLVSREASHDASPVPCEFVWWSKIDVDGNFDFSCKEEHFVEQKSAVQEARDERHDKIKALIGNGVTSQKEMVGPLDCDASTVNRAVKELVERGEVLKDRKTKKLSLPGSDTPPAGSTDSAPTNDDASGKEW